jgi:hypothetical protein
MHQMLGEQPTCKYLESMISACFLDLLVKRLPRNREIKAKWTKESIKVVSIILIKLSNGIRMKRIGRMIAEVWVKYDGRYMMDRFANKWLGYKKAPNTRSRLPLGLPSWQPSHHKQYNLQVHKHGVQPCSKMGTILNPPPHPELSERRLR